MSRKLILLSLVLAVFACKRSETPAASGNATPGARGEAAKPAAAAKTDVPVGTDVGSKMPEYSATMLDGSKFELAAMREKVVLLNVWATWCGPCRYEIPELEILHNKYASRGFAVVGVSVDESGPEAVQGFVTDQKMTYPVALDPDGKLASILQTSMLPTTVLVDREGKIVWKKVGAIEKDDKELATALEKALS